MKFDRIEAGGTATEQNFESSKTDDSARAARLLAAQEIAREAGSLAQRLRASPATLGIEMKGPQDFVTAADRAVERLVKQRLQAAFPNDAILGEEYGAVGCLGEASIIWAIDPIDGTSNYVAGRPDWCVSLGCIVDGEPEIGVIYQPEIGDLSAARRGQGARRNGEPIAVRPCERLADAVIAIEHSAGAPVDRHVALVEGILRTGSEYRRNGSSAVSLAQIASGALDGFVEFRINVWDVLAGIVLIREAGGWTSDFLAGDGLRKGNRLIAAAPGIRAALLEACGFPVD